MNIVIPTCGRPGAQHTLRQLLAAGLHPFVVVQHHELTDYRRALPKGDYTVVQLPENIKTIAPTRQYILENVGTDDKLVMVDDDLYFYKRRKDDPTKLEDISPDELRAAFEELGETLDVKKVAHAGFAPREGANRCTDRTISNTRIMRVLAYRRDILTRYGLSFDDMEVMEDFHVALQLLELGFANRVLNWVAHNQAGGSNVAGGCSTFRTPELHARNAELLRRHHPDVVRLVQKETKTAWGGGTRTDVVIAWKKAYKRGIK